MLIQPDTYIRLIRNCPLDNRYEHTIYFNSPEEQEAYFKGLEGLPFAKHSYQRYSIGVLTVQDKMENIYNCNYLMFRNTSFENKWFYAFVTKVEYVNNVTSRVYYEIDMMQTWFFNYTLGDCFVEREHSETDNIGDNLVPENLETGEFVYSPVVYEGESARVTPFTSFHICVLASFDDAFADATGGYYYSVYSGLVAHTFELASDANAFLNNATTKNKADGIVAVFMVPSEFRPGQPSTAEMPGISVGLMEYVKKNTYIDGHNVRNKKLYTMPYNSLLVTDHEGHSATYGYEYFHSYPSVVNDDCVALNVRTSGVNSPEYCIVPWFYKGLDENHMERVVISSTPQCSYNIDTFRAWLAQNKYPLINSFGEDLSRFMLGGLTLQTGLSMASIGAIGAGASQMTRASDSVYGKIAQILQHSTLPPTAKGNTGTGALNINTGVFGFSLYYCTIRKAYAELIDTYFDMYGYATMKVKKPNLNKRRYWNYVKTAGCSITGSIPADDIHAIGAIYDKGITFWAKDAKIGDYLNQDNSI